MKERIRKWFRKWGKKLSVGTEANRRLRESNPKLRVVAAATVMAIAATTANAQYYETYNYGNTYNSSRETFANQNTGGYTYAQQDQLRSDSFFMRLIFGGLSGLKGFFGIPTRDPSATSGRARSQMSQIYQ